MPAEPIRCVVLGGGGHARVVIDALRESKTAVPSAVLDANRALWGTEVLGVRVAGGDEELPKLAQQGIAGFVMGLGGTGDNGPRSRLFERARAQGLTPITVRHPAAVCAESARVGEGSVLLAASVVNAGAVLGVNVIVNSGAIVEHDCVVGDHVHLATGAALCGRVRVGSLAHIGAGATVRQCLTVGEGALVGGGAFVSEDVAPWTVVGGVPATILTRRAMPRRARAAAG